MFGTGIQSFVQALGVVTLDLRGGMRYRVERVDRISSSVRLRISSTS